MLIGPYFATAAIDEALSIHLPLVVKSAPDVGSNREIFAWIVERFGPSAFTHDASQMGGLIVDTEKNWVYRATGFYHFKTADQVFEFKVRWG